MPPAVTPTPVVPEGPAYQQILAKLADADPRLRARNACEAIYLHPAPNNINNVHIKPKRLTGQES